MGPGGLIAQRSLSTKCYYYPTCSSGVIFIPPSEKCLEANMSEGLKVPSNQHKNKRNLRRLTVSLTVAFTCHWPGCPHTQHISAAYCRLLLVLMLSREGKISNFSYQLFFLPTSMNLTGEKPSAQQTGLQLLHGAAAPLPCPARLSLSSSGTAWSQQEQLHPKAPTAARTPSRAGIPAAADATPAAEAEIKLCAHRQG